MNLTSLIGLNLENDLVPPTLIMRGKTLDTPGFVSIISNTARDTLPVNKPNNHQEATEQHALRENRVCANMRGETQGKTRPAVIYHGVL